MFTRYTDCIEAVGVSTGRAAARVGLLGNPSDGYGGRVLAMTVPEFEAVVQLSPADDWSLPNSELVRATIDALGMWHPELVSEPATLAFETTIPRQVGLSGSSAIIMAALRALANRAGVEWDLVELARVTMHVETEILRWAAGPQDRVVQAFTGLMDMNFATPWNADGYQRLDPAVLPPLFVAWDRSTGHPSDVAHSDVRQRWANGDPAVVAAMTRFAELAAEGRTSLDNGTAPERWPELLNQAFELRRSFWTITSVDTRLIATGTDLGAGVAFAGSGGAVVGCTKTPERFDELAGAYASIDAGFMALSYGPDPCE